MLMLHLYKVKSMNLLFVSLLLYSCSQNQGADKNKSANNEKERLDSAANQKPVKVDTVKVVPEVVSETDYDSYSKKFIVREKDLTEVKKWLNKIVLMQDSDKPSYMTNQCGSYVYDAIDNAWGYPGAIDEKTLRKKWAKKYDLKYSSFGHTFETGNGGWGSKKLANITYLGELNDGDWFRLVVKGGVMENDYSETIVRVVKVIQKNNKYYIDNFLSLSEE